MSASIARYLKDFGAPPPPVIVAQDLDVFAADSIDFMPVVEETIDLEAERAAAHAQGRDEATLELQQRFDAEKDALIEAHRQELEAQRLRFETDVANQLTARLQEVASSVADAVADQTARVLAPLLDDAVATKAVAELADQVRAAIGEGEIQTITVRGPRAMFEMLRDALGEGWNGAPGEAGTEGSVSLRHVEAADIDLIAELGDAVLVTRLSVWSANLKKVLG